MEGEQEGPGGQLFSVSEHGQVVSHQIPWNSLLLEDVKSKIVNESQKKDPTSY